MKEHGEGMGIFHVTLWVANRVRREPRLVLATMDGVTMPIPVMFADEGDAPVLGATALEILGFTVDPVERKLVPRDLFAL